MYTLHTALMRFCNSRHTVVNQESYCTSGQVEANFFSFENASLGDFFIFGDVWTKKINILRKGFIIAVCSIQIKLTYLISGSLMMST